MTTTGDNASINNAFGSNKRYIKNNYYFISFFKISLEREITLSNFKISTRLAVGFGFVVIMALALSAAGSFAIYVTNKATAHTLDETLVKDTSLYTSRLIAKSS
ncbi:hypothetical protein RCH09_003840 [Actimicrobium sp. GrIS 1.19]|uniref:hypothetical protein n=1 Tax=Actimicrobium sp. GrIS 1.19 TaxID=3071708 RepID=UPI002E045C39|nr:hypothetical protein [Actimicrobium sp. GrIS 1.19]